MNIGNNIGNIMKITGAWNTFKSNHPKFPAFCQAVSRKGLKEGSIIEIAITTPEGEKIETNLKVKDSDCINPVRTIHINIQKHYRERTFLRCSEESFSIFIFKYIYMDIAPGKLRFQSVAKQCPFF